MYEAEEAGAEESDADQVAELAVSDPCTAESAAEAEVQDEEEKDATAQKTDQTEYVSTAISDILKKFEFVKPNHYGYHGKGKRRKW